MATQGEQDTAEGGRQPKRQRLEVGLVSDKGETILCRLAGGEHLRAKQSFLVGYTDLAFSFR